MQLRIRATDVEITPSDTSGFWVDIECADAEAVRKAVFAEFKDKSPKVVPECVTLTCLNCGKELHFTLDSNKANGVFNVFCDGECEDRYAAKQ